MYGKRVKSGTGLRIICYWAVKEFGMSRQALAAAACPRPLGVYLRL